MKGIVCDASSLIFLGKRSAIDESVSRHGCRISLVLYQRLMAELNSLEDG